MSNYNKYFKAVKYLESIREAPRADYFAKKNGRSLFLKRTQYFLDILGNPEKDFKYIHVAGSTGKGSVATMIHQILTEDSKKAGLYTSPYITTSIEKIKVGNLYIAPNEFVKITEKIKPAIEKAKKESPYGQPSYFEIFMGISLLHFKQQKCEYVVLEVGMGGRYDATNIIKHAEATVINLIDLDHTEILGKTLTKIAAEKAAIIKPKTEIFTTSANTTAVLNIFKKTSKKNKVPVHIIQPPKSPFRLQVLGQNQQANAAIAAAVATKLKISKTTINKGLSKVKLSCRFEIIQTNPTVILDSAHNASKIKSVTKNLQNLTYKRLCLIIALTSERNPKEIFKAFKNLADYTYITQFKTGVPVRKRFKPEVLVKQVDFKNKAKVVADPHQALTQALGRVTNDDIILITGSIFLAGDLRKHWISEEEILTNRKSF